MLDVSGMVAEEQGVSVAALLKTDISKLSSKLAAKTVWIIHEQSVYCIKQALNNCLEFSAKV